MLLLENDPEIVDDFTDEVEYMNDEGVLPYRINLISARDVDKLKPKYDQIVGQMRDGDILISIHDLVMDEGTQPGAVGLHRINQGRSARQAYKRDYEDVTMSVVYSQVAEQLRNPASQYSFQVKSLKHTPTFLVDKRTIDGSYAPHLFQTLHRNVLDGSEDPHNVRELEPGIWARARRSIDDCLLD